MKRTSKKNIVVSYEPEADVLSWELTKEPIDYAEQAGNVIVHFSKKHTPVFVEVLNAKSFLARSSRMTRSKARRLPLRMAI